MISKAAIHIAEYSQILSQIISELFENSFLKEFDLNYLTKTQFNILRILSSTGRHTVSRIADILQISRAAASKNIEKLVRYNLVSRQEMEGDRRNVEVSLLTSGKKIINSYIQLRIQKQNEALANFSDKDKEKFATLLGKYVRQCLNGEKNIDLICMQCKGNIVDECTIGEFNQECRFHIKNN